MYLFDHLVQSLGNAEAGPSRQPEPELKPKQQRNIRDDERLELSYAQDHLEKTSKPHFRPFEVLQHRKGPATDRERSLACGVSPVTDGIAAEYVAEVKDINQNIKAMFEKQAEDARLVIHVIGARC
ncbi:hypothetical protein B0H14DRAFT_2583663 [Mycena olivaceomarginata]|nr:hypothetical protein B0H14DRAFT_2583663 [Mycena olivaceomarginata]